MATILAVDDDPEVLETIRQMLIRAGHEVQGAADGSEAIEKIEAGAFDLVITDMVMPDVDGIELILHLRAERPDLPVIAISGGDTIKPEHYLRTATLLGVVYTFTKPINRKSLLGVIDDIMLNR